MSRLNCIRCGGKPYSRHYIGGLPIDQKQERVIIERRALHLLGEIQHSSLGERIYTCSSIDLLTGFVFDSTFRPEIMGCERMLMSKMLDGHILRILIRLRVVTRQTEAISGRAVRLDHSYGKKEACSYAGQLRQSSSSSTY